ncbi:MAG: PfkB family carbohydrate kinase [Planctomycetota bacterium]
MSVSSPTTPVLVNGTLCVDTLSFADGSRHEECSGGCGMYFSLAAAAIGQPVRLLAAIGEDYPEPFVRQFEDADVDTLGLTRRPGNTFRWHGHYHDDLDDRDTLGLDFDPAVEALPRLPRPWADTRYAFLGVNAPENQFALRSQLHDADLVLLDTIDLYVHKYRDALMKAVAASDGLLINRHELTDLAGVAVSSDPDDAQAAAEHVFAELPASSSLGFVVVKNGPAGSVVCFRGHAPVAVSPCPPAVLVDPTGAGDTFAAGLLAYAARHGLSRSDDELPEHLATACGWGAVLASFTLEAVGNARLLTLTPEQFEARRAAYADSP